MTNDGELFITENVRDQIEAQEKEVADALRQSGFPISTAEPEGQSFGRRVDPKEYPDSGEVIIYVTDDDYNKAQVGRASFSIDHEIVKDMGGAYVRAEVSELAVVWKWDTLELLVSPSSLPDSGVPEEFESGPLV